MKQGIIAVRIGFGLLAGLGASLAGAHHGWSWYDGEEDFSLTAEVTEVDFDNPHDRMTVVVEGRQWNLLLSPPARSRNAGLSEEMVQVGDTVTAHGHRHREADTYEMKTERLQVGGKTYNLYPDRS